MSSHLVVVQTANELGGSERNVLNLLSTSPVKEHVTLALCSDELGFVGNEAKARGIDVVLFPRARLSKPLALMNTVAKIADLCRQRGANALAARGTHPQVVASLVAKSAGLKSIFMANMIYTADPKKTVVIDQMALHGKMDFAFANSNACLRTLAEIRPDVPMTLMHPGTTLVSVSEDDISKVRNEFGISKDIKVVSVFGRLQNWKGQDVFVEAAHKIFKADPTVHFMVVGGSTFDLEPEFAEGLKRRVYELGLNAHFTFTGFRNDVAVLMKMADVVCHTSRVPEPFGMVVIEAMAQGRPMIATQGGGPADIIEEGKSGKTIPPEDPSRLANEVIALLSDEKKRQAMGMAAKVRIANHFSLEAMAQNFWRHAEAFLQGDSA